MYYNFFRWLKMEKGFKVDGVKIVLSVVAMLILLCVVILKYDDIIKKSTDVEEKMDALQFKEDYEKLNGEVNPNNDKNYPKVEIDENNPVKYSTADEIVEVLEKGTGIIYLGYPKCPWCRNAVPVLLQAASDAEVDNIYYIDMYDERDSYTVKEDGTLVKSKNGTEGYQKLLKALDGILDEYYVTDLDGQEIDTNEKRIYVPLVVFVKDGEIIGSHADTVESQKDPYVLLNDEQREELYEIYDKYIHEMLNDLCDERC